MITHLIFDLDNTLYSVNYGLENKVSERIQNFVSELLNISHEESEETHRSVIKDMGYGTTLEWLMTEKGFTDVDFYYGSIYPENEAETLLFDPELKNFLASIPLPKAVLTNSNKDHAYRILNKLGIAGQFQHVFDITLNNYKGKPHREVFNRVFDIMKAEPGSTLLVDDYPEFIAGYNKTGGKGLLLDELDRYQDLPFSRIKSLYEISGFL